MMPRSGSPWVKQGESIRSLYSLPVTRTSPSGQKYCSPSKLTSRSGSSESPARNGDPLVFQAVKSASLFGIEDRVALSADQGLAPGVEAASG